LAAESAAGVGDFASGLAGGRVWPPDLPATVTGGGWLSMKRLSRTLSGRGLKAFKPLRLSRWLSTRVFCDPVIVLALLAAR